MAELLTVQQEINDLSASPRSDITSFDQFFDAQETISRVSSVASSQGQLFDNQSQALIIYTEL